MSTFRRENSRLVNLRAVDHPADSNPALLSSVGGGRSACASCVRRCANLFNFCDPVGSCSLPLRRSACCGRSLPWLAGPSVHQSSHRLCIPVGDSILQHDTETGRLVNIRKEVLTILLLVCKYAMVHWCSIYVQYVQHISTVLILLNSTRYGCRTISPIEGAHQQRKEGEGLTQNKRRYKHTVMQY